jgi:CheY-like chemotaxis protein
MTNLQGAILEATTRGELAAATARALRRAVNATSAYTALVRGTREGLEIVAVDGDTRVLAQLGDVLRDGAEKRALGRTTAIVNGGLAGAPSASSAVIVPIGAHGVAVAVVHGAIDPGALEEANTVGAVASAALRHLRGHEETHALNRRLQGLLELQRALASGILEDAFAQFATRLSGEIEFDVAWVGMIGSTGNEVELIAGDGDEAPRSGTVLSLRERPLASILQSARARAGGPTFVANGDATALASWARSGAIVPLAVHDALVGVLVLLSRGPNLAPATLAPDAGWLLAAIAEPLAMAVQNAALVGRLRSAMRDWQATFDVMDAMVLVTDESGLVRRANWALARRVGATPSAVVGRPVHTLFPGQNLPSLQTPKTTLTGPRGEPLRGSAVSLPGGGTVVVIHDARATSASSTMPALRRISTGPQTIRGRVLIVDDEPSILRAVSRTLARTHDVVTATDGDEALDMIRRDPLAFDAVMTDVQMPRMTGVDLYRAIEREFPRVAERVLFMTGGVFASEVESFLRGLKERVLRKPFDPELLRRVVDERVALSRVA